MYDMQTLHAGGIPMFRGTYLVWYIIRLDRPSGSEMVPKLPTAQFFLIHPVYKMFMGYVDPGILI